MSGGSQCVHATFWLLEAPDSLARQSRREPDGTGLGYYGADGHPVVSKRPVAAYEDPALEREAKEVDSRTFVAHVRYASTGGLTPQNTHPFEQEGRLFALITREARLAGDVGDGVARAARWVAENLPLFAINLRRWTRTPAGSPWPPASSCTSMATCAPRGDRCSTDRPRIR